jgi:two-component system cell cycle response regulator DivK
LEVYALAKKHILLVEDNETNLILFQEILESRGYLVHIARNGFEAFDILEAMTPDLILMDIHLPELDGLSVVKTIRSANHLASVKIVGLSALAMDSDIKAALQAGCNGYITKPISVHAFIEEVERHLAGP